jgi:hypothetical protein
MIQALSPYYNFKLFSKNRVEDVFFDDVDMVAVPGGIGDADVFKQLFKNNGDRVRSLLTGADIWAYAWAHTGQAVTISMYWTQWTLCST